MMNKTQEIQIGSTVVRVREPEDTRIAKVGLLLHGWTGDEMSMWVFGNKLDHSWLLFSPRAPYSTTDVGLGGYSWVDQSIQQWPTYQEFFPAVNFLKNLIKKLSAVYPLADFSKLSLIGFSQGAAMALVFAGVYPLKIQKLVLLSGFIPEASAGYLKTNEFNEIDVFIGHGNHDDIVPVSRAKEAKDFINGSCRSLVYCTSDVGHKLGSECFTALQNFMNG